MCAVVVLAYFVMWQCEVGRNTAQNAGSQTGLNSKLFKLYYWKYRGHETKLGKTRKLTNSQSMREMQT